MHYCRILWEGWGSIRHLARNLLKSHSAWNRDVETSAWEGWSWGEGSWWGPWYTRPATEYSIWFRNLIRHYVEWFRSCQCWYCIGGCALYKLICHPCLPFRLNFWRNWWSTGGEIGTSPCPQSVSADDTEVYELMYECADLLQVLKICTSSCCLIWHCLGRWYRSFFHQWRI